MRVKSQKLGLANNWPPSCLVYADRHFAKIIPAKCTKLQTNVPVKICHLKVYLKKCTSKVEWKVWSQIQMKKGLACLAYSQKYIRKKEKKKKHINDS